MLLLQAMCNLYFGTISLHFIVHPLKCMYNEGGKANFYDAHIICQQCFDHALNNKKYNGNLY